MAVLALFIQYYFCGTLQLFLPQKLYAAFFHLLDKFARPRKVNQLFLRLTTANSYWLWNFLVLNRVRNIFSSYFLCPHNLRFEENCGYLFFFAYHFATVKLLCIVADLQDTDCKWHVGLFYLHQKICGTTIKINIHKLLFTTKNWMAHKQVTFCFT